MSRATRLTMLLAALLGVTVGGAALGPLDGLGPHDAEAVVGRPLTPVSYAGVARRTSRRTVRRTAAVTAPVAAAPVAAAAITTLPAGCARTPTGGSVYYRCGGGAWYQPYYQGTTVVYQTVPAP